MRGMDQERADYADRDLPPSPLPRLMAGGVCGLIGISVKAFGDWQGGYRECDLVAAVFIAVGAVIGWQAVRRG